MGKNNQARGPGPGRRSPRPMGNPVVFRAENVCMHNFENMV